METDSTFVLFQATLNDSFLADLDELSDNEDDLLVSILICLQVIVLDMLACILTFFFL